MAINKVQKNNNGLIEVLIDLTADTVDAAHLAQGYTAHSKSGEIITGTMPSGITVESLSITENGTYTAPQNKAYTPIAVNVPKAIPIEINNDSDMTAALIQGNLNKCYKFTGTTGTYVNGDLYIVVEE